MQNKKFEALIEEYINSENFKKDSEEQDMAIEKARQTEIIRAAAKHLKEKSSCEYVEYFDEKDKFLSEVSKVSKFSQEEIASPLEEFPCVVLIENLSKRYMVVYSYRDWGSLWQYVKGA